MSASKTKVLLSAGAIVLLVLVFFAPRNLPASENAGFSEAEEKGSIEGMDVYRTLAIKTLDNDSKGHYERLKASKFFDSLQDFWMSKKRPALSAIEAEEKAMTTLLADDYFAAGRRYYNAVRFAADEKQVPALYQSAIRCFDKATELDPDNTDARIMLASCYVEGGRQPMEGIRMLQEIEKTDSANIKLQLSFAFFSVKSGQYDKAIQRFSKVLSIDSTYLEAYLHLADAYEQQSDLRGTVNALKQYARRTDNITAKLEVEKYIRQLESKINH